LSLQHDFFTILTVGAKITEKIFGTREGRGAGPGRHPINAATPCQPDERFVGFFFSSVCKRQNGSSTVFSSQLFIILCYIRTNSLRVHVADKNGKTKTEQKISPDWDTQQRSRQHRPERETHFVPAVSF
jgi:hypothetical protein